MLSMAPQIQIFMANRPVDMRKGLDGLMAIVRNEWQADIFSGALFVFLGRNGSRIKILRNRSAGWLMQLKNQRM